MQEKRVTRREIFGVPVAAAGAAMVAASPAMTRATAAAPLKRPQMGAISWPAAIQPGGPPSVLVRHDFVDGEWRPCCPVEAIDRIARYDPESLITCEMVDVIPAMPAR